MAAAADIVVSVRGVEITQPADWIDDIELVEDIALMDAGETMAANRVLHRLARDAYPQVVGMLRGEDGRVRVGDASEWAVECIVALNGGSEEAAKN